MKHIHLLSLFSLLFIASCTSSPKHDDAEEWIQLFNKKDLTGWDIKIAHHDLNDNFNNTFYVKDSILEVDYSRYEKFNGEFGHLYYKEPFSYYKVRVEYRFAGHQLIGGPGYAHLNSGVMLHSQSAASNGKDQSFPVSLEMQLLSKDSTETRPTGNLCTPGTQVSMYGKLVESHCINSSSKSFPGPEWVTVEAIVMGDSIIRHIVNGDTVLTYEHPQVGGGFVSKDFNWTNGGFGADSLTWTQKQGAPLKTGYIALQAESHPVEFRKVELLNLEGCMDKSAENYKSYYIKADNSKCTYKK
jgi:hypothetical protein